MNVHAQMKGQMLIGGEMVAGEANKWIESTQLPRRGSASFPPAMRPT